MKTRTGKIISHFSSVAVNRWRFSRKMGDDPTSINSKFSQVNWLRVCSFLWIPFIIIFLALGIATLSNYGLAWDEGLGNIYFGQRYSNFLLTFDEAYLDFSKNDFSIYDRIPDFSLSTFRYSSHEFPPFADTLSATVMEIVGYGFGWLDPIEAYHLTTLLLVSFFLVVVYKFVSSYGGSCFGFLSIVLIASYPRIWADMHFNGKDIPEMVFFSLTLIAFYQWYRRPTILLASTTGLLFSMALAVKANALFIPAIVILGVWPWRLTRRPHAPIVEHLRDQWKHYAVMFAAAIASFVVLMWPFWWTDPYRVVRYFQYIFSQGGRVSDLRWNADPLIQAVLTIPETVLVFLFFGIVFAIQKPKEDTNISARFLLVWVLLPIFRASVPGMVNFDGIRHFQEYVPAACILAAFGVVSIVKYAQQRWQVKPTRVATLLLFVLVMNLGVIHLRYYPFQQVYYNSLIGGVSGAQNNFNEATDYWGVSYRKGMEWLSQNTTENAFLYTAIADHIVRLSAPLYLRDGIVLMSEEELYDYSFDEGPVYVMFITRKNWYRVWANYCVKHVEPIHEIVIDGASILQIYELESSPGFSRIP